MFFVFYKLNSVLLSSGGHVLCLHFLPLSYLLWLYCLLQVKFCDVFLKTFSWFSLSFVISSSYTYYLLLNCYLLSHFNFIYWSCMCYKNFNAFLVIFCFIMDVMTICSLSSLFSNHLCLDSLNFFSCLHLSSSTRPLHDFQIILSFSSSS